jgi:hypothetical protein
MIRAIFDPIITRLWLGRAHLCGFLLHSEAMLSDAYSKNHHLDRRDTAFFFEEHLSVDRCFTLGNTGGCVRD